MAEDGDFDRNLLLDAVFQIIDASFDSSALFQEAHQLSRKLQDKPDGVSMKELLSVSCLELQETKSGITQKVLLSTPTLAKEVIRLSRHTDASQPALCLPCLKTEWDLCLDLIKESIRQEVFIPHLFTSWISKHEIALGFLWDLHTIGAYNFQSYLFTRLKEETSKTSLCQTLLNLCQAHSEDLAELQKSVLTGVTSLLVANSFQEDKDHVTKDSKMCLGVLDQLLEGILNASGHADKTFISPFCAPNKENDSHPSWKKFTRHALSYCLQYQADFKISENVPTLKEKISSSKDSTMWLTDCLKQLMTCLSASEAVDVLSHCLKCGHVNSRAIYAYLNAFLSDQTAQTVIDFVKDSLSSGLQDSDLTRTSNAFYIARLCCTTAGGHFPSYRDWFQITFGESSTSVASGRASFTFLVKCLTTWTPEEDPDHLKAHILRRPFIPARMRETYESYVTLAKTRLDDLKISLRDVGSSDPSTNGESLQSAEQEAIIMQQVVEENVKSFEESGKIPTTILEASIFRKPYFVGKFLPALLKPRCLPDKPDSRMRLIDEIKKSGRIPPSMISAYKENCEKEKQSLFQDVFDVNGDDDEEMLLPPMEQLQFRLNNLKEAVTTGDKEKVREAVSQIQERLYSLIDQSKEKAQDPDSIEINMKAPMDSHLEKIIVKVLTCLSGVMDTVGKNTEPSTNPDLFDWLDGCIKAVARFACLKAALLKHIFVCLKKRALSDGVSFRLLGAVCVSLLTSCSHLWVRVQDSDVVVEATGPGLVDLYSHFLSCCCWEDVAFTLSFMMAYFCHANDQLDRDELQLQSSDLVEVPDNQLTESQLFPASITTRMVLLCWRYQINSSGRTSFSNFTLQDLLSEISSCVCFLKTELWAMMATKHKPSFDTWLQFESRMSQDRDILARRQRLSSLWETATMFTKELGIAVCSGLFNHLATSTKPCFGRNGETGPLSTDSSVYDLVPVLKGLLLQLPKSDGCSTWLLSNILACHDRTVRSSMLSFSLHLPPHLFLSNHKQKLGDDKSSPPTPDQKMVSSMLDLFVDSDLNDVGCFPVDVLIFLLQAWDSLPADSPVLEQCLDHPAVFSSVVVHFDTLSTLGVLQEQRYSKYEMLVKNVISWAERVIQHQKWTGMDYPVWQHAIALFSCFKKRKSLSLSEITKLVNSCPFYCGSIPSYLLELTTVWMTFNYDLCNKNLKYLCCCFIRDSSGMVSDSLKSTQNVAAKFRAQLGLRPEMENIRLFSILRLCCEMSQDKEVTFKETMTPTFLTWFIDTLEKMDNSTQIKTHTDDVSCISSWLQGLVESCSPSTLKGINAKALRTCDPLLYRKVYTKTNEGV